MRTATRTIAVTAAATMLGGLALVSSQNAMAATVKKEVPSACRPANHGARITQGSASAGHSHYRVTLVAPRGYASCELAGSPADVRFYHHGHLIGITAGRYGPQKDVVVFGPGRPVHFDIQVRNNSHGTAADEAAFPLRTPHGVIPGRSTAHGRLTVTAGTVVGPVRPGA
ncbi:DUF4232 domain-containing protein [Actinomadura gamaensis]|uniref:DUF4232 domain-containing protein n=1 Tax=Actinomadura gamaensis TaxID=1763541 RepID=A0ABV9U9F8_9ACTN